MSAIALNLHDLGSARSVRPSGSKDWDLDLKAPRYTARTIAAGRKPPKLVHNLVFSMPTGTPPEKLLKAVRTFAREKFALQHRYALALHTDQGHPHVHVVVKAESEQGVRLNIRKATLREWRRDFTHYLRELGVEANATERAVRGKRESSMLDGIYRPEQRGVSRHTRERVDGVASDRSKEVCALNPLRRSCSRPGGMVAGARYCIGSH